MDNSNDLLPNLSILTIDDDLLLQQSIAKMFVDTAINVMAAPNGEIGLRLAKKKQPDLILLDWNMPKLSGIEVLERLKKDVDTAKIPVIMMTAVSISSQHAYKALHTGADDFLRKPFEFPELIGRICSVRRMYDAKDQIEVQNKKLKQLADEKSKLLAVISHDLKSPLNNIEGLLHLIGIEVDKHAQETEIPSYLKLLDKIVTQERAIIDKTLELHEVGTTALYNEFKEVDLVTFIKDELHNYSFNTKQIQLHFKHESSTLMINTLPNYLQKVFANLISNSLKYSNPNTAIEVSVQDSTDYAQLLIKDEGQGFHSDEVDQVFQKFGKFSSQPTGGESSAGIGLYIIKSIMDKLGGSIQLKSKWGKGSTFTVVIPKKKAGITQEMKLA